MMEVSLQTQLVRCCGFSSLSTENGRCFTLALWERRKVAHWRRTGGWIQPLAAGSLASAFHCRPCISIGFRPCAASSPT